MFQGVLPELADGTVAVDLFSESGVIHLDAAVRRHYVVAFNLVGQFWLVVTPARAAELGLDVVESGFVATAPTALTSSQRSALGDAQQTLFPLADSFSPVATVQPYVQLDYAYVSPRLAAGMIRLAIVIGALLFTLIVVAIGLSLSAAESRDERDVLASIGAKPSAMRRVAGLKATWLALAGGLLAIPTGYLPLSAGVAAATTNRDFDVGTPFPWWIALGIVIAVPLIAGFGAWLASSVAQTVRPVRMSTLSAD
jgi:ABC-type antimicrobial peptide transport system permease subunit